MKNKLLEHIEKLNLFVAVANAGSFRAAAERIRLSQPALSQAIQGLEGAVGTPLFHRSKKGVKLTRAGEELLKFSERLIVEVAGIEQRIKFPDDPMSGVLNVGTFASFLTYLWPPLLNELSKEFPKIQIQLSTLKSSEITAALSTRKFHLIVSTELVRLQDAVNVELYRDSCGFFYSKKHFKTGSDWKTLPMIYVPQALDSEGHSLEQIFWQKGLSGPRNYSLDSFEAVKAMALEGLGVAVLPLRVATRDLTRVQDRTPYGKTYAEHVVYCSYLSTDRNDPRSMVVVNGLKKRSDQKR